MAPSLALLLPLILPAQDGGSVEVSSLLQGGELGDPLVWWKVDGARRQSGGWSTPPGSSLRQPLPAYAPLAQGIVLEGEVGGRGQVVVWASRAEGDRVAIPFDVGSDDGGRTPFRVDFTQVAERMGEPPVPRFEIELKALGTSTPSWVGLSRQVPFPRVSREELRREILEELDWIFELWFTHGSDQQGPRSTAFMVRVIDVVTGKPLAGIDGDHNVFFDLLFRLAQHSDDPRYQAAFDSFLEDYLELCLHPETGLPRHWDARLDQPRDGVGVEIASKLGFLIDMAMEGPPVQRGRCLEAAQRIADTVLARGVAPDGGVAAKYRPLDGRPDPHVTHLRRLDLPAQLGRLAALEDPELGASRLQAAVEAAAAVEYALRWPGTWEEIDPGFDDIYGHFGQRASELLAVAPEEAIFRRLSVGGLRHYLPLWWDAVRLGGNVAADQVRCWEIAVELIDLEPSLLDEVAPILAAAARGHLSGQQYGNGAWGDVTVYRFDPRDNLQVGDLPGMPQNLLYGLALLHDERLEGAGCMPLSEVRALFAGVLRSTRTHYRRPFGYLSTRREVAGANPARGSIALATALIQMLEALDV